MYIVKKNSNGHTKTQTILINSLYVYLFYLYTF